MFDKRPNDFTEIPADVNIIVIIPRKASILAVTTEESLNGSKLYSDLI